MVGVKNSKQYFKVRAREVRQKLKLRTTQTRCNDTSLTQTMYDNTVNSEYTDKMNEDDLSNVNIHCRNSEYTDKK